MFKRVLWNTVAQESSFQEVIAYNCPAHHIGLTNQMSAFAAKKPCTES